MFDTAISFAMNIESMCENNRINHLEAVLLYCEENQLEPDEIKHLISSTLKEKIEQNLIDINLMPRKPKLNLED